MLTKQARGTCWIAGPGEIGVFSSRSGGTTAAEIMKWYDAGDLPPQLFVGIPETENVTIMRRYGKDRDHGRIAAMKNAIGNDMHYREQLLDKDNNPFGKRLIWQGKLISVDTGEYDANVQNTIRQLTLILGSATFKVG